MTEHEKLKEICDLIRYELPEGIIEGNRYWYWATMNKRDGVNVREIIFTKSFMRTMSNYLFKGQSHSERHYSKAIMSYNLCFRNIEEPVQYLYNLLELGKKQ